jgi:hypothetical protein
MDIFAKNEARKNTKISFRTDDETLAQLKSICRIENRTISSLIENILAEHVLVHEHPLLIEQEKRQSPRKKCSIPAVLVFETKSSKHYHNSMIVSLSSSSTQLVLKNFPPNLAPGNSFFILFNLPKIEYPILLKCELIRYKCFDNECVIISNFIHENKEYFEVLQNFLISADI